MSTAVARITKVSDQRGTPVNTFDHGQRVFTGGPAAMGAPAHTDIGAVVLRASHGYQTWTLATWQSKLYVGDIVGTGPDTFAAFEFYTGGQISINKRSWVKIVSENRAIVVDASGEPAVRPWWSPARTKVDPLQIRTSSGLLGGIKG